MNKSVFSVFLSIIMTINMVIPSIAAGIITPEDISLYNSSEGYLSNDSIIASSNTVSSNVWDLLKYSGKEPVPMKALDGNYYIVKGAKFNAGTGATSSDKKVFNINKKGIVKVKKGSATITSLKYGDINVTVINPKLSSKNKDLNVGDSTELTISDLPEGLPVGWVSTDQNVIQVHNGKAVAVGIGKCKVLAYVGGKALKCSFIVRDKENSTLLYNTGKKPVKIKGIKGKVEFDVSDNSVTIIKNTIKISSTRKTPVSGNVSDGHKLCIYLNDTNPLNKDFNLKIGEPVYVFSDNCHEFPDFKSKKKEIATITEYGVLVGTAPGKTVIKGKLRGEKFKFNVNVSDEIYTGPGLLNRSLTVIDPINDNPEETVDPQEPNAPIFPEYYDNNDTPNPPGPDYHTITVDANGGKSRIKHIYVKTGERLKTFTYKPEKDGTVFDYWDIDGVKQFTNIPITKDCILRANWKDGSNKDDNKDNNDNKDKDLYPEYYDNEDTVNPPGPGYHTITVNPRGGSINIKHVYIKDGDSLPEFKKQPLRENFIFTYWDIDGIPQFNDNPVTKDCILNANYKDSKTGIYEYPEEPVDPDNPNGPKKPVPSDNNPTPTPIPGRFTVTVDPDGGTFDMKHFYVRENTKFPVFSAVPVRDGWIFNYWDVEGNELSENYIVTHDITITAKWKKKNSGYTPGGNEPEYIPEYPEKPNRYDNEELPDPEIGEHTITIDTDGGTFNIKHIYVKDGDKLNRFAAEPVKNTWKFILWQKNGIDYNYNEPVTEDFILKAKWGPTSGTTSYTYKVNHKLMNLDGITYSVDKTETKTVYENTVVTPKVKNYEGFTSPSEETLVIDEDNKEVNYLYSRNKYHVNTVKGNNIASVTGSGDYFYGATVTLQATLKENTNDTDYTVENGNYRYKDGTIHKFESWSDGKTTENNVFTMPSHNVTLTATGSEKT